MPDIRRIPVPLRVALLVLSGPGADRIPLDANPLDSVAVLRKPLGVMLRGHWLPRETLDEGLESITARNRD